MLGYKKANNDGLAIDVYHEFRIKNISIQRSVEEHA